MDSKELRIGNLFMEENSNEIIEVIGLEKNRIVFSGQFLDKWQAKPIPITEGWLLKFGYFIKPWGYVKEGSPLISFSLTPNQEYWIELGNGFKIYLPYVHTLQNFFQLTGDELKQNN